MNLPFSTEQFLAVFEQYNVTVWPVQVALNLLALTVIVLALKRITGSDKIIAGILGFFWIWIGAVYHIVFFASINPAANIFGALNIVQGLVFLYYGVIKQQFSFDVHYDLYGYTGAILMLYGLLIYPLLGLALGHVYPKSPTFGLPCPTTIFTFGMLLWSRSRMPKIIMIVPFFWSLIGSSAALTLGIHEDIGLLVAGIVGTLFVFIRDRKRPESAAQTEHRAA
jgi:hypothetical protein